MRTAAICFACIIFIGLLCQGCASRNSKKGCDGRKKTRVEMGWM